MKGKRDNFVHLFVCFRHLVAGEFMHLTWFDVILVGRIICISTLHGVINASSLFVNPEFQLHLSILTVELLCVAEQRTEY